MNMYRALMGVVQYVWDISRWIISLKSNPVDGVMTVECTCGNMAFPVTPTVPLKQNLPM